MGARASASHRWTAAAAWLIAALLGVAPAAAQPLSFDASNVGAPASDAAAELFLPDGPGPFPAVILLHGCDGVGPHYREWGRRLVGWGYAALMVDSLRPRRFSNICNRGELVPGFMRARDAFGGARYLRTLPVIRGDRIGIVGFSHGAFGTLQAALVHIATTVGTPPFAAAIAFYPGCEPPRSPLATDLLILIGDADDWTSAAKCVAWRDLIDRAGHAFALKLYPGALHSFDYALRPRVVFGHHLAYDAAASEDAFAETRAFLDARLMAR